MDTPMTIPQKTQRQANSQILEKQYCLNPSAAARQSRTSSFSSVLLRPFSLIGANGGVEDGRGRPLLQFALD